MKCSDGACIQVDVYETAIRIRSTKTGTVMQASPDEWAQFLDEVKAGKWDAVPAAEVSV